MTISAVSTASGKPPGGFPAIAEPGAGEHPRISRCIYRARSTPDFPPVAALVMAIVKHSFC
jgi:hypothetical protein